MDFQRSAAIKIIMHSAEALAWLQQDETEEWRTVGDSSERLTHEDALRLVQELYSAGAIQVLVVGKYLDEEGESADYLEVMLPQNAEARNVLFRIQSRVLRDTDSAFDPDEEQGQTSFTIGW